MATVILIVTYGIHNVATIAHSAAAGDLVARASHPISLSQIAFMLFVTVTSGVACVGVSSSRSTT